MNKTIDYYNKNAKEFIAGTINADMSDVRARFLKYVKPGGRILDAGCGSGRDAKAFLDAGYAVDAFDASEEICKSASRLLGFDVACARFEDLTGSEQYDGIWACASLLHVSGEDLPDVMKRLRRLLRPGGVIYASFKYGSGERIKDGRFFCDMTDESCRKLFEGAGLTVIETFMNADTREGREDEKWVNVIGGEEKRRKMMNPSEEKVFAEKKKEEQQREELSNAPKTENKIASVLLTIGWLLYIAGFTLGIAFGQSSVHGERFNASIAFIWWGSALISGTLFLGFAEVIKLLQEIRDK